MAGNFFEEFGYADDSASPAEPVTPAPAAPPAAPEPDIQPDTRAREGNFFSGFGVAEPPAPVAQEPVDIEPTWEDYGRLLMSSSASLAQGAGWLIERVGRAIEDYGLNSPVLAGGTTGTGIAQLGEAIKRVAGNSADAWMNEKLEMVGLDQEGLSENARNAMRAEYLGEASMGQKWQRLKLDMVGSLPGTALGMSLGGLLARGATTYLGNMAAYGAGEALVAAPAAGADVEQEAQKYMDRLGHKALLEDSPEYAAVFSGLSGIEDEQERIDKTQQLMRDAAAGDAAALTAVGSILFGAMLGNKLDSALTGQGSRVSNTFTGALAESSTEFPQSAAEAIAANIGMRNLDTDRSFTEGALEAGVGGAAAGGLLGGGMGALTRPNQGEAPPPPPTLSDEIEAARDRVAAEGGDALDQALAESEILFGAAEAADSETSLSRIGEGMNTVDAVREFNQKTGRLPTSEEIQEFKRTGAFPDQTPVEQGPQTLEEAAASRRQERQKAAQQRIEEEEAYGPEEQAREDAARAEQQAAAARRYEAQQDARERAKRLAQETAEITKALEIERAERQRRDEVRAQREAEFEAAERQRAEQEQAQREADERRARAQLAEQEVERAEAVTETDQPGPTLGDTPAASTLEQARERIRQRQAEEQAENDRLAVRGQEAVERQAAEDPAAKRERRSLVARNGARELYGVEKGGTEVNIGDNRRGLVTKQEGEKIWTLRTRVGSGLPESIPLAATRQESIDMIESQGLAGVMQAQGFAPQEIARANRAPMRAPETPPLLADQRPDVTVTADGQALTREQIEAGATPLPPPATPPLAEAEGSQGELFEQTPAEAPVAETAAPATTGLNWATTPQKATKKTARTLRKGDHELVEIPIEAMFDQAGEASDVRNPDNQIGDRLQGARERLEAGEPMDPPLIGAADAGNVMFDDGRHRAAAALELGETTMPALVPKADVEAVLARVPGARRMQPAAPEQAAMDFDAPAQEAAAPVQEAAAQEQADPTTPTIRVPEDRTQVQGYSGIKTKTLRKLVENDDRIVGVAHDPDGVFIYTDTALWTDDAGAGTFMGQSEMAAIRAFKERVQPSVFREGQEAAAQEQEAAAPVRGNTDTALMASIRAFEEQQAAAQEQAAEAPAPTKTVTISKAMLDRMPSIDDPDDPMSPFWLRIQDHAAEGKTKVAMNEAEAEEMISVLETQLTDPDMPRGAQRSMEKLLERVEQLRADLFAARPDEATEQAPAAEETAPAGGDFDLTTAALRPPKRIGKTTASKRFGVDKGGTVVESTDGVDMLIWKDDEGIGQYLVSSTLDMNLPTIPLAAFTAKEAVEQMQGKSFREFMIAARSPNGQPETTPEEVDAAMQAAAGPDLDLDLEVEYLPTMDVDQPVTELGTIDSLPDEFEVIEEEPAFPRAERERLKKMVAAFRAKYPSAKFQVVDTIADLPAKYARSLEKRRAQGKPFRASGIYNRQTGEAFVILENAKQPNAEAVMRTMLHEVVQHQGMRGLLGNEWNSTLDRIWHNGTDEVRAGIERKARQYKFDMNKLSDRRQAVDEYMAGIAGSERGFDSSWFQEVMDAVRAFLREVGLLNSYTDNDIRRLLRMSRERLREPGLTVRLESGEEVSLDIDSSFDDTVRGISAVGIFEGMEEFSAPGGRGDRALMEAFVARTRKANRGKRLDARSARNKDILSSVMADEVAYALMQSGHAADWYSQSLTEAVEIIGEIHPEVRDSAEARSLFMLGLSITSNGADVLSNARAAERVWRYYKRYRKFPTNFGTGPTGTEINNSFEKANDWIQKLGTEEFVRFLNTEYTVGELNLLGVTVSGESVNHRTYGSAMFGPKIGGGFYQNLMGNYSPLTMDRWWMKMWGRITGTGLPAGVPTKTRDRFLAAIEANPDLVEMYGMDPQTVTQDDRKLFELARRVHAEFSAGGYKERTEFNRAAKNVDLFVRGVVLDPGSASNRAWMREVTEAAVQKLADRNINVNTASLQALLWYPEKELYRKYAGSSERAEGTDYAKAFETIFRNTGGTQDRIDAARARAGAQRDAAGARSAEPSADAKRDPRVTLQLGHAAAVAIRRLGKPAFSRTGRSRPRQLLSKARAIAEFKPAATTKARLAKAGLDAPSMFELEATPEAAAIFRKNIMAAKKSNGAMGAAVHVYEQSDYEGMRLFTNDAGTIGFALKGDDIVSLFKSSKDKSKGAGIWTPLLAVQEGGRRLDAFDTVLPHMYAGAGFKVVARTPFNEEFQPEGWNQQAFSGFNGGKPDVVFMVYDKSHDSPYSGRREGDKLDYDAAAQRQLDEVMRLEERNKPSGDDLDLMFEFSDDQKAAIDSAPDSPLARLHKLGATVEAQTKAGPSPDTLFGKVKKALMESSAGDKAMDFTTALVPRRYLSDFTRGIDMPQVDQYMRTANRMTGRRNELLTEYEAVAERWAKFASKNKREGGKLSEIMHASTLAGADPSKPFKPKKPLNKMTPQERMQEKVRLEQHRMLKEHYDGLSQEAKEIYNQVRDSYQTHRRRLEQALYARIENSVADGKLRTALNAQLREKFEAGRVEGPYFPLMRYGEYYAVAKDANGEVISFSKFEKRTDQKNWAREFRDAGYEVTENRRLGDAETLGDVDPEFVRQVQDIVQDPELQDEIWQTYLRTLPEMSIRKQFIHRKGRLGFAADALRGYAHLMFHGAHQISRVEYMPQLQQTLQDMKKQASELQNSPDEATRMTAKHVYDEMEKRHKMAVAPNQSSPWANMLTSFGFGFYLGATPAAAAVNLTQTAIVAYPLLGAKYGFDKALVELSRLSQWYGAARGNLEDGLRGEELQAFMEAKRVGVFDRTMSHDIAGVADTGADEYGSAREKTMRVVSFFFHRAEQMNREVTFMAAYRLARNSGTTHDDAILAAEDATWDAHFDYNNENRPTWMQGNWPRVFLLFKQYSLNMTYRIGRDFMDSFAAASVEDRKEARRRFAGIMGMTFMFAGLSGLPTILTGSLNWVLNTLLRDDEEDPAFDAEVATRVWLTDMVGATAAEAIMKGPVDTLTPVTLSSRVGLGELWIRDPQVGDTFEESMMQMVTDFAGPIPSIALSGARGLALINEGQVERGVEKFMPKAVADIMKAHRYATEGALTLHSPADTIMAQEEFTWPMLVAQAMGFTPSELTLQYDQNQALRNAETRITQRRQEIIDKFALATFADDAKAKQEQIEALQAFNRKYPTLAITGNILNRSLRTRVEQSARSNNGLRMNPKLRYLEETLRFTEKEDE